MSPNAVELKPSSFAALEHALDRVIGPQFGHLMVAEVTATRIEQLVRDSSDALRRHLGCPLPLADERDPQPSRPTRRDRREPVGHPGPDATSEEGGAAGQVPVVDMPI